MIDIQRSCVERQIDNRWQELQPAQAASAEPETRPYDSWYAGVNTNLTFAAKNNVSGTSTGSLSHKSGITLPEIVVGYRPQSLYNETGDFRFELELSQKGSKVDKVKTGSTTTKPNSDMYIGGLMANAYYDLHTGTPFTPFVGAGLGAASYTFHHNPGLGITDTTSRDAVLAYQTTVGVSYTPQSLPRTDWSIGYNYYGTDAPSFDTDTGRVDFDRTGTHNIKLGFKYHF
jgi:opacity protein-like surface antigen